MKSILRLLQGRSDIVPRKHAVRL